MPWNDKTMSWNDKTMSSFVMPKLQLTVLRASPGLPTNPAIIHILRFIITSVTNDNIELVYI